MVVVAAAVTVAVAVCGCWGVGGVGGAGAAAHRPEARVSVLPPFIAFAQPLHLCRTGRAFCLGAGVPFLAFLELFHQLVGRCLCPARRPHDL